ncbi:hypothetical protein Unana1_00930 [Umbelopsis nana]
MDQQQQQYNNHAFQAGFSKAKDEFEAGYKAAIGSHQPAGGPIAPGQQSSLPGGDMQQQHSLPEQQGYPQQGQSFPHQQMNQQVGANAQPGFAGGAQSGYVGDVQTDAYQQHKQDLNQDPGAGDAFGGVQQQAYEQHKNDLNQNPGAGGALGGVQEQAYNENKAKLDEDPSAGGAQATSTGPTTGGPIAPGQQSGLSGGDMQQQHSLPEQEGYPQQGQSFPHQQMNQPVGANAQPGFAGGAQSGYVGDVQTDAYQQHKQDLNQDPGAGDAFGGVQQQAYEQHKNDLNQNPGAGGALGGVQEQAYNENKAKLDEDPSAGGAQATSTGPTTGGPIAPGQQSGLSGGDMQQQHSLPEQEGYPQQGQSFPHQQMNQSVGANAQPGCAGGAQATSTGPTTGGPGAGVTGGNLNSQLDEEAARHSGPPHGLGSKIKSKLPHHFNDGTKVPRELREDASGQTGPGPM